MISEKQAISLLRKYGINQTIINHCIGVGDICYEIADKINRKSNQEIVNPYKAKITGLLHDIGKSKEGIHEINSVEILKEEGLIDLSEIVLHGFIYEYYKLKGIDNIDFLPKNLEQKIIVLSDMYYNQNQQRVTIDERFDDILERYSKDFDFIEVVRMAKNRMLRLEKEINALL